MRVPVTLLAVAAALSAATAQAAEYSLVIARQTVNITGQPARSITINGQTPGPTLHFREGETATIHVTNRLKEPTSVHWHGLILDAKEDGVPGFNGFSAIKPGQTYTYSYTVQATDPIGVATVAVSGTDLAGNTASLSSTSALNIVPEAPSVPAGAAAGFACALALVENGDYVTLVPSQLFFGGRTQPSIALLPLDAPMQRWQVAVISRGRHELSAVGLAFLAEVERVPAERVRRHLAVEDLAGDVGIVGRDLPPALVARIGGHPHEADIAVGEGLELGDLHLANAFFWGVSPSWRRDCGADAGRRHGRPRRRAIPRCRNSAGRAPRRCA